MEERSSEILTHTIESTVALSKKKKKVLLSRLKSP